MAGPPQTGPSLADLSLADLVAFAPVAFADWQAAADGLARPPGGGPPPALTLGDIPVARLYRPATGAPRPVDPDAPPGAPGAGGWRIEQRYDHPDPAAANRHLHADLARGVGGVWLRLDRAGRQGCPTGAVDDAGGHGTGGATDGIAIATAEDLGRALDGVRLDLIHVAFDAGRAAPRLAAVILGTDFLAARGVALHQARLAFDFDPLGLLAAAQLDPDRLGRDPDRGPDAARAAPDGAAVLRPIHDAAVAAGAHRHIRTVGISAVPYHDAGATAVHELAYAVATGMAYLRSASELGWPPAAACRQMRFVFAVGNAFFAEVAKLRAARRLWGRVVRSLGAGVDAAAGPMAIHAVTSARARGTRDPWVNLVRGTTQALAAAVGGADSIATLPFDGIGSAAGDLGRRLATHTQTILQAEAHAGRIADAAAGSPSVEALTDALARRAWDVLRSIERGGGMGRAIASGRVAAEMAEAARARRDASSAGDAVVVGETRYVAPGAEGAGDG